MVRNYIRKRPERTYTTDDLKKAVSDVVNKRRSYRKAASHYGIPSTVILNRIKGRKTSVNCLGAGRPCALSPELEHQLEELIVARAEFGYPMDKQELFDFVQSFCNYRQIKTPFKDGRPGQDWYQKFMKRHPRLSLKKAQSLQNKRAEASDPFVVYEHYNNLQKIVTDNALDNYPELFFNCDESGFCTDPSKIKSIGIKNKSLYQRIRGTGRENITINVCISADGYALPPHIIFQGSAVLARWTGEGEEYPGTLYAATPKGYMEEPVFYNWFSEKFVHHVSQLRGSLGENFKDQKALLMYDGHKSHISARLVSCALTNNIVLLRLPSHLTHRLQPLDIGVFSPLKKGWDRILLTTMRQTLGQTNKNKMSRKEFSIAVKELWTKYLTPDIITSSFVGSGSLPVDASKFPESDFDQAALTRYRKTQKSLMNNTNSRDNQRNKVTEERESVEDSEVQDSESDNSLLETGESATESVISETVCAPKTTPDAVSEPASVPKRSALDFFINQLKSDLKPVEPSVSTGRQIRLKQYKYGEVLTSEEVLKRLEEEETRRRTIGTKRKTTDCSKKKQPKTKIPKKNGKARQRDGEDDTQPSLLGKQGDDEVTENTEIDGTVQRCEKSSNYIEKAAVENTDETEQTLNRPDQDVEVTDQDVEVTDQDVLNSYFAIASTKTWYVGLVIEICPHEEVKMKFLDRVGNCKFRWPCREKIETVSTETFLTRVTLHGESKLEIYPPAPTIHKMWIEGKRSSSL